VAHSSRGGLSCPMLMLRLTLLRSFLLWSAVLCCSGCNITSKPFSFRNNAVAITGTVPEIKQDNPPSAVGETLLVDLQSPVDEETYFIRPTEYSLVEEIESIQTLTEELESAPSFVEETTAIQANSEHTKLFSYNEFRNSHPSITSNVFNDHINFYSLDSMIHLSGGLAVGAIIANTDLDREWHKGFQDNVTGDAKNFFHSSKELGNAGYTLPVFAGAWAAGKIFDESHVATWSGEWGGRSMRSLLVGTPPMLLFQNITGGSRPGETDDNSRWEFFGDSNGVSGHSFMGALPFINAAKMTDNPWLKTTYYVGSTLVPISRITDDAHYPSQAILGWWFAYLAASAVDDTQNADRRWKFTPMIHEDQQGGMFELWF
jgi:hypothetical protein